MEKSQLAEPLSKIGGPDDDDEEDEDEEGMHTMWIPV
jgi:hypothetical protein